ncbi:MAG TPA: lysyl oxidase family protein [Pyrinomonadaceae bacterium]|nr:lysyl oxidase family protein [Pyrinomonadaceae bacterium]
MKIRILVYSLSLAAIIGAALLFTSPGGDAQMLSGPNLQVREDMLKQQWVVRDENLSPDACSVIEGEVTPGLRRLVRFTVTTPNVGDKDIVIGDPNAHFEANDGLFEFASCHHHYHFRHYAIYQLIDPKSGKIWRAAKRGFCMLDTDPNPNPMGGQPPKQWQYRNCGAIGIPGNQGISAGWADTYRFYLAGQFFVLDGGDGQAVVPPGEYIIRVTVNPPFVAKKGEACPYKDTNGFCHQLPETNYDDNVGQVTINIPAHPGRAGHGPLAGDNTPTRDDTEHECNSCN